MNIFRVPLNLIVVLVLVNIGNLSEFAVFMLASGCLVPAVMCQFYIVAIADESKRVQAESPSSVGE
jgi:hypothetical protein